MRKYSSYKDSGVEWIGEIPSDWQINRLANFGKFLKGRGITKADLTDNGVPVILYGDIYTKYDLYAKKLERKTSYENAKRAIEIHKGDLLFTASGETKEDIGKCIVFLGEDKAYASGDVIIFRQLKNNSMFLAYVFNSYNVNIQKARLSKGEIVVHIYASQLRNIHFALPPFDEQTQIANYLDQKTTEIETLITKKEQLIKLLEEERTAMINQAVTKGLDPNVPMKDSGIDWLGEIPEHWVLVKLKYLTRIRYGLGQPPKQKEGGLPIIRATNVYRGTISEENMIYVDPDDLPLNREPILKENDIIVVRSGAYTADSAIIEKKWEGTVTGYDLVMTPKTVNPKLLSFALLSTYMLDNQLFLQRLRAAQPHLNSEELGNTFMLLPPDFEQIDLVDFIENELLRLNEIKEKVKKEIDLLKEYKTALISEVVTGKIDVREEVLN